MLPEPSAATVLKIKGFSKEEYTGFPSAQPKHSFFDVIKDSNLACDAKEIVAYYVLHTVGGSEAKPAWAFTLRGIPPLREGGDYEQIPLWQRNHLRLVTDAMTGENIYWGNGPHPDDPTPAQAALIDAAKKKRDESKKDEMGKIMEQVKASGEKDPVKIKRMIERLYDEQRAGKKR